MDIMDLPPEGRLTHTLQTLLARKGCYDLRLDGLYGPATTNGVERFKRINGMVDRDYVGPLTWAALADPASKSWEDFTPPIVDAETDTDTPPMLAEAIKHLGVAEVPGSRSNPVIMGWARDLKAADALDWYPGDDIAWCGLFQAILALRCHPDLPMPPNVLSARNWGGRDVPRGVFKDAASEPGWGEEGPRPQDGGDVPLGSTGIMWRTSKTGSWHGHIGVIDAANRTHVRMIGGNQANSVKRSWYPRNRFLGTRLVPGITYQSAPSLPTGATGDSMT